MYTLPSTPVAKQSVSWQLTETSVTVEPTSPPLQQHVGLVDVKTIPRAPTTMQYVVPRQLTP